LYLLEDVFGDLKGVTGVTGAEDMTGVKGMTVTGMEVMTGTKGMKNDVRKERGASLQCRFHRG
jgi:hypothetical protein